ncbi:MAG: translation initiation factor IF-2 [Candidatus Buchananbacteria bacterium RBG_13_39_9]|uniref:Translation initiation factor IF-2 n=1 Tax=Candidatus Buchananbacteria bacterium RBG_13_39_9 TaxID=1797531 RepID=A0A1G1XS74_9BACT|nr:MAG: translation initiation factor IF-2 [Candidatus Buchananbacteria bacterium RBG_13_39_9]
MNVSELARKLKVNSSELFEILPEFGFDIGKRAIKVDSVIAQKILKFGPKIKEKILENQKAKLADLEKLSAASVAPQEIKEVKLPLVITVRDLAAVLNQSISDIIKKLMQNGVLASLNERIDYETAAIIADEFGIKVSPAEAEEKTYLVDADAKIKEIFDAEEKKNLKSRPPVVVVMGHVDHGKTKLLDTIRKTNVIDTEAGGITQHIGAYQVKKKNQLLTFIDTPGHEAFTAMRARGAKVADIAILVVAANDSVKPQTLEAIKIIQQAQIPMIIAINKIDLPEANIEQVKKDLSSLNLIPEDWGGKTICQPISAKGNIGIDDLLETIILVYEMEKEKIVANPNGFFIGTVIEAHIDKGEGPVATVLVQNGTLKIGDNLVINEVFFGKARALKDFKNHDVDSAIPSMPVKIIGLKYSPKVGDLVEVVSEVARKHKKVKEHELKKDSHLAIKIAKPSEEEKKEQIKKFNLVIKTDVLGSLEAITESLEKIESQEIKANIIAKGLGNITDADVDLAASSNAIILGFKVKATSASLDLAREKKVEIKYYEIIYKLLEEMKQKMSDLLTPEIVKKIIGKGEVLAIFKTETKKVIIGVKILEGKINKGLLADIYRKKEKIGSGEVEEVQIGKEKVSEVVSGQDCGISLLTKAEIKANDLLEIYQEEKIIKKI